MDKKQWEDDKKEIKALINKGHPRHCACRQVWGDGECECDFYKKGYNPYAWIKNNKLSDLSYRKDG